MNCAWNELIALLPQEMKKDVDSLGRDKLQELRLRLGKKPELVLSSGSQWLDRTVTEQQLQFVINMASKYSPWAAATSKDGYISAAGGHRIGICGTAAGTGIRDVTSLNIRVARDFPGIADGIKITGNTLIIGPPGCGKTTLLRDLARKVAAEHTVTVVDEREELFPAGFVSGVRMDRLSGFLKPQGIGMALRTMGPEYIAVDEITAEEDCRALLGVALCGVKVLATAHASNRYDLIKSRIYEPIVALKLFETLIVMGRDKSWCLERMVA